MARYIVITEVAKIVRKILKENFADVKFSVCSDSYAGGSSIRVNYTDGPTVDMVEALVGKFEGASFDGMIDLKSYQTGELDGEEVRFGNDYIFVNRSYSAEVEAATIKKIEEAAGDRMPFDGTKSYTVFVDRETGEIGPGAGSTEYGFSLLNRALAKQDLYRKEKVAA